AAVRHAVATVPATGARRAHKLCMRAAAAVCRPKATAAHRMVSGAWDSAAQAAQPGTVRNSGCAAEATTMTSNGRSKTTMATKPAAVAYKPQGERTSRTDSGRGRRSTRYK